MASSVWDALTVASAVWDAPTVALLYGMHLPELLNASIFTVIKEKHETI